MITFFDTPCAQHLQKKWLAPHNGPTSLSLRKNSLCLLVNLDFASRFLFLNVTKMMFIICIFFVCVWLRIPSLANNGSKSPYQLRIFRLLKYLNQYGLLLKGFNTLSELRTLIEIFLRILSSFKTLSKHFFTLKNAVLTDCNLC